MLVDRLLAKMGLQRVPKPISAEMISGLMAQGAADARFIGAVTTGPTPSPYGERPYTFNGIDARPVIDELRRRDNE